jgi:methylated-DNA-[protein]-cysteine S-methyltransferase
VVYKEEGNVEYMKELLLDQISSPIGKVLLVIDDGKLCSLDYEEYEPRMMKLLQNRYGDVQLKQDTIPVSTGGTPFQQEVWQALRTIAPGTTSSYGALAALLGRPKAYRAVGATNALNPVAIVLPCHRVVGANAALTGYAGGLERKRWLLQHEQEIMLKVM